MAKKIAKQNLFRYVTPVDGACAVCGCRVRPFTTPFCKQCGTARMPYKRSMLQALTFSVPGAVIAIVFSVVILQVQWLSALALGAVLAGMMVDFRYIEWRIPYRGSPASRSWVNRVGWSILAFAALLILDNPLPGLSMLGIGVAVLIVVHYTLWHNKNIFLSWP